VCLWKDFRLPAASSEQQGFFIILSDPHYHINNTSIMGRLEVIPFLKHTCTTLRIASLPKVIYLKAHTSAQIIGSYPAGGSPECR
jgi:hypothetical protein